MCHRVAYTHPFHYNGYGTVVKDQMSVRVRWPPGPVCSLYVVDVGLARSVCVSLKSCLMRTLGDAGEGVAGLPGEGRSGAPTRRVYPPPPGEAGRGVGGAPREVHNRPGKTKRPTRRSLLWSNFSTAPSNQLTLSEGLCRTSHCQIDDQSPPGLRSSSDDALIRCIANASLVTWLALPVPTPAWQSLISLL